MKLDTYTAVREALIAEQPIATATIVAGEGLGAKMTLTFPDQRQGTLGDPALDDEVSATMQTMLRNGGGQLLDIGERRVFIEAELPPPHLVIIGAVHTAIPLVTFGHLMGYRTTVIDARGQFATDDRFPHADQLIEAWPDEALLEMPLHPGVAAVCLAHDEKFEDPVMKVLLNSDVGYIGAIGSRATSAERLVRLGNAGFTKEQLDRIHGPVGLHIGGKSPAEIALSIMAEIVAVKNGKDPKAVMQR